MAISYTFNPFTGKFDAINSSAGVPATETTLGTVYLGAYCYNNIPLGTNVVVPSGQTLLQAGNLTISGSLDLTSGDICWVD